jgi:spermidine synthase
MKTQRSEFEFLAHQDTPIGTLILRRGELPGAPGKFVTEITIDHEFLMSSHITYSERALSRIALEMHPGRALRVLVGGLGLGYTAWEVLQSDRVATCDVVEYVPAVIDWMKGGLVPLSEALNGDSRCTLVRDDVYQRLADAPEEGAEGFDLILIDVDHAPHDHLGSSENNAFYTAEGLRRTRRHLASGGLLGVWSYAGSSPFTEALGEVFTEVRAEPVTFLNDVMGKETTDWLFFARG